MTLITRALFTLMLVFSGFATAAPKSEPWPKWEAHDEASPGAISHEAWDKFLAAYVKPSADGVNRVAYRAVTRGDKKALETYIGRLQGVPISKYSRAEQRAYWINLYNAETVYLVVSHPDVKSIRDIKLGGVFSGGPWEAKILSVEGEKLALNDIEHRILRPIWHDPRTHYSVNCASFGCPNLQPKAYTGSNLEGLLDAGAKAYVNSPRGATVSKGKLTVSSIYKWFADDFGGTDEGVIAHLKRYAAPPLAEQLKGISKISDNAYDWSLNSI